MRRAFTLIELLAIVVIIATMVGVAVLNFRSGQDAARLKGSVRDAFATIRHARSMALLSKQPSIITYSTVEEDGEPCARIEVHTAKIFSDSQVTVAETIDGETIRIDGDGEGEPAPEKSAKGDVPADPASDSGSEGKSVEEMLFEPLDTEMFRGISLKVIKEGDEISDYGEERAKPKISVFSNVDFLLGKFNQAKAEQTKKAEEPQTVAAGILEAQSPESFVWEVNGRTEPHKVWFYRAGTRFDEGLCISVDRFGAAKVLSEEDLR